MKIISKFFVSMTIVFITATSYCVDKVYYEWNNPVYKSRGHVRVWNPKKDAKITKTTEGGMSALKLTAKSGKAYLTPIIDLKAIPVSQSTVLSFDIRCPHGEVYKINLTDEEESSWYYLTYQAKSDEWTTVRLYLGKASFRRKLGNTKIINDGLLGDHLIRVQIEAKGNEVMLRNFKIYDTGKIVEELPPATKVKVPGYSKSVYPQFNCDGFFPYGVIITVKAADERNAAMFGQTGAERFELDLADIKRHGFNTVCNFMDESFDVGGRLNLMEKYHLNIFETIPAYLALLNKQEELEKTFKDYDGSKRLLAWYGRDEPRDLDDYMKVKKLASELSPHKPFCSAFDTPFVINALGPLMEFVVVDRYPLTPYEKDPVQAMVNKTAGQIRFAAQTGARVWSINQAYSLRRNGDEFFLRYPKPEEIRFDFFNSIAAGSEGIIYFIHCDEVPYLDSKRRREEFDMTLTDAWYNSNPTYDVLSELGRKVIPVMPSMLGAKELKSYNYNSATKIVRRAAVNKYGIWRVVVNGDLKMRRKISLPSGKGRIMFDAIKEKILRKPEVTLNPGEGAIILYSKMTEINRLKNLIAKRRILSKLENLDIAFSAFDAAGIELKGSNVRKIRDLIVGKKWEQAENEVLHAEKLLKQFKSSSHRWIRDKKSLDEIRTVFGKINHHLVQPNIIVKYDGKSNSDYLAACKEIKSLGTHFFSMYRDHSKGKELSKNELSDLYQEVKTLLSKVKQL